MKKGILILAILCILTLLPVSSLGEVEFNLLYQYKPKVTNVAGTNYLIIQTSYYGTYGLFTTDGKELIPCKYAILESLGNHLFSAAKEEKALNGRVLVDRQGNEYGDFTYTSFKILNQHWVLGYVLNETELATEEKYDLKYANQFYYVARTDLFYVNGEGTSPVASASGLAFTSAQAHGKYLSVQDEYGNVVVYNQRYQAMPVMVEAIGTPIYTVQFLALVDTATGDMIGDGYTKVSEANSTNGMLLIAFRTGFDGSQMAGIFDEDGNELAPIEYPIASVNGDYAILKENNKQGLYSLKQGKLIAPCQFDSILTARNSADPFVNNGYILVENDGVRSFYDVEKGEITCTIPQEYYETMIRVGSVCYVPAEGGFTLIAADGTVTLLEADSMANTAGDGYLLVAKRGDFFGVVDWHGNEVLPFYHKTAPVISQDSMAIIRVSTGSQVEQIIR